ncbi:MAG: ABC transporter permease [Spirochaetaceae bacterium]
MKNKSPKNRRARPWERPHAIFLAVLLFLLLFFYIPVGHVFIKAFVRDGSFVPGIFFETLISPYTARLVGFTFLQAALSTLFSLLLGLPGAYIITKFRFPGRSIVRSASAVPFVLPPILVVLGFVIFFGNNGFLNRALMSLFDLSAPPLRILYSLKAIILAHGFYNFPIALRVVSSLWQSLPPTQEWAASTLGARGGRLFRTITLPQLLPSVYAAAALIFMFCFTSFAVILVLGGGPSLSTVEVEIYRLARISFDLHTAAALSIIALLFTLAVMYIYVRLQSSSSYYQAVSRKTDYSRTILRRPGKVAAWAMGLYAAGTLTVIAGPLVAIILNSLRKPLSWSGDTVFTLQWYRQILGIGEGSAGGRFSLIAVEAVSNSAAIGVLATAVAVPVGVALSYYTVRYSTGSRKIVDTLTMAPMTTSSVVLGLGYLLISRTLSPPSSLSPLFIVGAHAVISYPFVVRTVSSVLRKISPSQRYAAMLLGSPPGRVFRTIELPLIAPAIFAGAAFTFGISLGEMNATIVFSSSTTTIPVAIYRLIGSYNFFGACALGTILILVSLGAFLLLDSYSETEW